MKITKSKILTFWLIFIIFSVNTSFIHSKGKSEPFGSPQAKRGGQLVLHTSSFPKSFNYFVNTASDAASVFGLVYDTLLEIHPNTLEFQPLIAKSWEISPDKMTFTFWLDPRAKWADGQLVTTADIKFTYDTIMNPQNLTSVQRMSLSRFHPPEVLDQKTIRFQAKNLHYNNLVALASLSILPQHLFGGQNFNKAFNMHLPPGSGPYRFKTVKAGRYYILKRRPDYWADQLPSHLGMYNFDQIKVKVMDSTVAFEAFKKGTFDIYSEISAKLWVTETKSKPFRKNWIVKQKIFNYAPQGFSGLAFNLRKPLFQDLRVRQALAHLLDRNYLLQKLMYNQYQPLTSYWPALSGGKSSANQLIKYQPKKAKKLLHKAGYNRLDKQGFLINKAGKRLEFTVYYPTKTFEKHLTFFAETCRRAGVKVNLQLLSWATLLKKIDNYQFDTVVMAWSASLFPDPEQLWHSQHASEPGGSNLCGYQNARVDKLIDSLPPIFEATKRNQIIQKIDRLIYKDTPYILFWGANYTRIFYKNIFGKPQTIFPKYSSGDVISYWWYDPVKVKRYQQALQKNKSLPKEKVEIHFDQITK